MTALTCYLDESIRENVHVVAGYLAPDELWTDTFVPDLTDLLRSFSLPSSPLTEFKARDCAERRGEFKDIPERDRRALTDSVADILIEMGHTGRLLGVAAVMVHPGVVDVRGMPRAAGRRARHTMEKHGYGYSLGWCLYDALRVGAQVCGDESVRPVLDRREGFFEVANRNWEGVVSVLGGEGSVRFAVPESGDSRAQLPLQAADLLAYETRQEAWHRQSDYPLSYVLKRLVAAPYHQARVMTLDLAEPEKITELGNTPFLYKTGMHVRSLLLWHGQHFTPAVSSVSATSD